MKELKDFPGYFLSEEGDLYKGDIQLTPWFPYGEGKIPTGVYPIPYGGKKYKRTIGRLLRENYPYEWIKYLEDGEECREIEGYKGYFITSRGRIWSSKVWRFMTPTLRTSPPGYYYQTRIGKGKSIFIHTEVGRYFLPEYREGMEICHRDETLPYPEINYKENLWVGTHKENMCDMSSKGRGTSK